MTIVAHSQSWKANADALIVNQIFANTLGHSDIYTFPDMLTSADTIILADGTFINVPYANCYGYFIDPQPYANWAHPCKYCFVNASYNHVTTDANMPPARNDLATLSLSPRTNILDVVPSFDTTAVTRNRQNNPENLWAVLICGDEIGNGSTQRFWFDLSCIYTVLANVYGYLEAIPTLEMADRHIIVTAPEGIRKMYCDIQGHYPADLNGNNTYYNTFADDFFYTDFCPFTYHKRDNIQNIFECFAGTSPYQQDYALFGLRELTEKDQLFIFVTGHGIREGNRSYFNINEDNGGDKRIYEDTFAEWIRNIKCSQITLLMENCFSGGFVDRFLQDISHPNCLCKNRIGQSSVSANNISNAERYRVYSHYSGNSNTYFVNEFVYYWASAALGYYPYLHDDNGINGGLIVDEGPWMSTNRKVGDGSMNWAYYFGNSEYSYPHSDYESDPDTDGDGILSLNELFEFANNLDTWSEYGYYLPNNPDLGFVPEDPQQCYESSFTRESATLVGYEGQIDGSVDSGESDQPYRLCGDVWVGPNASLTMSDEVQSPDTVKIIVKPKGRLVLDRGHLTNLPENGSGMWVGVQVWGDSSAHQYEVNGDYLQGYLELKKGASIENAICAVELWHPNDLTTTGGIIHAVDATFLNNGSAVRVFPFKNYVPTTHNPSSYNSNFKNCSFIIDNDYIGTTVFNEHVSLTQVYGLKFLGCDFSVNRSVSGVSSSCSGILANQSSFFVDSHCTGNVLPCPGNYLVRSSFTGFKYGINASYFGNGTENFTVHNTDFYDNNCGIYTLNAPYATILSNNFTIGNNDAECAFGIYADKVTGFCIEENEFRPKPNTNCTTYGIAMINTNNLNEIHRNQFGGLSCANIAIGQNFLLTGNTLPTNPIGLTYSCNDNTSDHTNTIDFCVLDDNSVVYSGIQQTQGSSTLPAGNTFGGTLYHFYNDGDFSINYYYNQNQYSEIPGSGKVEDVSLYGTNSITTCPSHYGNGPVIRTQQEKAELASEYLAAHSAYESLRQIYESRINGGSTVMEVSDIINARPSDMWQLRSQLLSHSPYLTQEVLTTAADRDDVFTSSVLFEILSANPDELKKDTLISYLENKDTPLPDYMIDLLRQIANGATARTALEAQMAKYSHDFKLAAGDMVRSNLCDTVANPTELRTWLAAMEDIAADRLAVASYLEEGNFSDAFTLANMLPNLYGLEGDGLADHIDYMSLIGLYHSLGTSGRSVFEMTEEEITMVEGIADEGLGTSKAMAETLLSVIMDDRSDRSYSCPNLPEPKIGDKSGKTNTNALLNEAVGFKVSMSPNPATTWTTINCSLPTDVDKALLTLTSTLGVKVMEMEIGTDQNNKVLDLRNLSSGVYGYTVRCGEYVETGKLVITK